jgi:hypothetical protein
MPTRSLLVEPRGAQVPRVRHAPSVRANDWEDVADLAKAYGLVLDPWQENVLQGAMGVRSDGQWATPRVGVSVPRQNGKGALIEARELAGLLLFGEQTIIHSAHEQKTARVGFERIRAYFENYDDLRKKVRSVMSALGREHIKLTNGCELHFPARSKGAIRGFSIDCLILDEAQILGDPAWEAIKPTISARPNVQTWLLGTPPTPLDDGAVFTRIRQAGHEGKDHRLSWFEWSAPRDASLDSREAWAMANPAFGIRITEEAIADERAEMSAAGFARERLGIWSEADAAQMVIAPSVWEAAKAQRPPLDAVPDALGLDRWYDGSTSVAAAWREREQTHVELVAVDVAKNPAGVVAWLTERAGRKIPVLVASDSPAAALVPDLEANKVKVKALAAGNYGKACIGFVDDVEDAHLTHAGQEQLTTALGGATKRDIGQAGLWGWDRRSRDNDISPLVAATLARHGAVTKKQRSGEAVFR